MLVDQIQSTQRIIALEPGADALGLFCDQKLGDARALIPTLEAIPADATADHAALAAVAAWCDRYTPLVALAGDGNGDGHGVMLDITGAAHLFGGEQALLHDIRDRLTAQGFTVRTGLADTIGAAHALARFGDAPRADPGDTTPLMALPLQALRIDATTVEGLRRVGFRTIGCIAGLPRAPLGRRFGADLMTRLDQALGRAAEVMTPSRPPADLTAEKPFFDPITHQDDIARAITLLSQALVPMLEDRGLGAREIELRLFRVDGVVEALTVAAANPLRNAPRIAALFAERIAGLARDIDAGFGFDLVKLAVLRAEPFDGAQHDLVDRRAPQDSFDALADRLAARLGPERIRAFAAADTHIPERATGTLPLSRTRPGTPAASPAGAAPAPPLTRPLYLLARPEPVETLAEVPDGPPIRFRWRKVPYAVTRSEGPERIACEWWRDGRGNATRDYFRVEGSDGHRFWMFRQGLYDRDARLPRWYMHGLCA